MTVAEKTFNNSCDVDTITQQKNNLILEGRSAKPFLKWAGSKQALIRHIVPHIPEKYETYLEPFLGGGAMFFHLQPKAAILSDASAELINVWTTVRNNVQSLSSILRNEVVSKERYYEVRGNPSSDPVERAAQFIYLNKTCWNGLYRVNSRGQFNVPYGKHTATSVLDEYNLTACSNLMSRMESLEIHHQDFSQTTKKARQNDFVYLDPPYVNKHKNNGFRDYNENLFSWGDQIRLANEAKRLRDLGAKVIVSQAAHVEIEDLYRDFAITEFQRPSTISSIPKYRGNVSEFIITANI